MINRKRVQRVWREEGLRVPQPRRKRQRLGDSTVPASRLRAERPDHVWAFDFQFDQTADGHIVKLLNVVDEFTREALEIKCARSIDADATVKVLEALTIARGRSPQFVRCDNGPEMTANALKDWCRFSGTGASYIDPGSPWQNPYVEPFGSRVRDEMLAVMPKSCSPEFRRRAVALCRAGAGLPFDAVRRASSRRSARIAGPSCPIMWNSKCLVDPNGALTRPQGARDRLGERNRGLETCKGISIERDIHAQIRGHRDENRRHSHSRIQRT